MPYHVVPSGSQWKVRKEGSIQASAVRQTKARAEEKAKDLADNYNMDVIVHRKDGTVQR